MLEQEEVLQEEQYRLSLKLLEQRLTSSPGHQLALAIARGETPPTKELLTKLKRCCGGNVSSMDFAIMRSQSTGNIMYVDANWPDEIQVTDNETEAMQWSMHEMNRKIIEYGQGILDGDPDIQTLFHFCSNIQSLLDKDRPKRSYTSAQIAADGAMSQLYPGIDWRNDMQLQRKHNRILLQKKDEEDIFKRDTITMDSVRHLYSNMELMEQHFYKLRLKKQLANGIPISFKDAKIHYMDSPQFFFMKPVGFKESTNVIPKDSPIITEELIDHIVYDPDYGYVVNTQDANGQPIQLQPFGSTSMDRAWQKPGEPFNIYCKRMQGLHAFLELERTFGIQTGTIKEIIESGQVDPYKVLMVVKELSSLAKRYNENILVRNMLLNEGSSLRNHMETGKLLFNALFFRSIEEGSILQFKNDPKMVRNFFTDLPGLFGSAGVANAMDAWRTTSIPLEMLASGASRMSGVAEVMMDSIRTTLKPHILIQGNPLRHGAYLASIAEVSTYPLERKDLPFTRYQFPPESDSHVTLRTVADPTGNIRDTVLPLYTNEYACVSKVEITCGGDQLVLDEDFYLEYEKETGHYRVTFTSAGQGKVASHGIDEYRIGIIPDRLAADATPLAKFVPIEDVDKVEEYAGILEERGDTQIATKIRKLVQKARTTGGPIRSNDLESAFIAGARYGFTREKVEDYYREVDGYITPAPDADGTTVAQCSHAANLFSECIQYCAPNAKVGSYNNLATIHMPFGFVFAGAPHADVRGELDGQRFRHDPTPAPNITSLVEQIPKSDQKKREERKQAIAEREQSGAARSRVIEKTLSLELATKNMDRIISGYDSFILQATPKNDRGQMDLSRFPAVMHEWRATLEKVQKGLPGLFLEPDQRVMANASLEKVKEDLVLFYRATQNEKDVKQRDQIVRMFGPYTTILWNLHRQVSECITVIAQL